MDGVENFWPSDYQDQHLIFPEQQITGNLAILCSKSPGALLLPTEETQKCWAGRLCSSYEFKSMVLICDWFVPLSFTCVS